MKRLLHKCIVKSAPLLLTIGVLACLGMGPAQAQDGWRFTLLPYAWVIGIDGDIGIDRLEISVDASFGDILDNLDMAFLAHLEAKHDRWTLFVDPNYLRVSTGAEMGPAAVKLKVTNWLVDMGVFYQLFERPFASDRRVTLQALGGTRYTSTETQLKFQRLENRKKSESWIDPIVGLRLVADLSQKLDFLLRADIGGFGVGSDLTWSTSALLGYQFTPTFSLWGGYRTVGIDYEDNGSSAFKYDVQISGPLVGLAYAF